MRKNAGSKKTYYFPDKLKTKLSLIPYHPITVVEAPAGFGKTTAIREYLRESLPEGAKEYWYTCLGEPAAAAWKGICELLAFVNGKIAANLKKLEMPTIDTVTYLSSTLRDFECREESYLVIDNYQYVNSEIPRELISVFSLHGSPNLHIIFITQQLGSRQLFSLNSADIHIIDSSAFFFDREGTAALFRMKNIRLTEEELKIVCTNTEGWVSAIQLQIMNFEETGSFDQTSDLEQLVENAIWNRLSPEEKEFLLSVSVIDSFTARQAAIIMGRETLPGQIEDLLKTNDFIRYFPDKKVYTIHSILQDYLRNRFYHYQSEDFQARILRLTGNSFAALSQLYPAARYYFRVGDYDAILSLPWNGEYISNQKENSILEFIRQLVDECPRETLCRYPFAMLTFCPQMLMNGYFDAYQKLCGLIAKVAETNADLSPGEAQKIRGELIFLNSFESFNDVNKMREGHQKAWDILGAPSGLFRYDIPFTFGCVSVLFMFWREAGQLDGALRDMAEWLPLYRRLTGGHGAGADSVMRAEAMLMRGDDNEAEIQCHRALYEARSRQQTCICLCAEFVLARIAVLRGDTEGFFTAVKNIQNYPKENFNLYVQRMSELCMTSLNILIGNTQNVAKWFRDLESIRKTLYRPAVPYAQTLYQMLLVDEKRYNEFFGISQGMAEPAAFEGGMRYVMPELYYYKYLAVAKHNTGCSDEAQEYFNQALTLALPDRILLPFAQQAAMWEPYIVSAKTTFTDKEALSALSALCRRQEKGMHAIKKAVFQNKSPLTPREREIALLARDRLSAKEIADKLYITETTVRTILKSIYSKLDIHSKAELNSREF